LTEEESRHCLRVLRLKTDDIISVVDGAGNFCKAVILETHPHRCRIKIFEVTKDYRKRHHHLHLAITPPKSADRFEWFLEKATEIGCDEITPVICRRSERDRIKEDRSVKILISAMKQAGRAYLPQLNVMIKLEDLLDQCREKSRIILHCEEYALPRLGKDHLDLTPAIILIGPEGDFTRQEIDHAKETNFSEATLGPFTYRTETAGIMACQIFNWIHNQ